MQEVVSALDYVEESLNEESRPETYMILTIENSTPEQAFTDTDLKKRSNKIILIGRKQLQDWRLSPYQMKWS